MRSLDLLLTVHKKDRSNFQILLWWEKRRILYNLIVLCSGIASMTVMYTVVKLKPGEDMQEPITILGFVFLCNLCYTLGWITEISGEKSETYGPKTFKIGLYFTLFWVFLPAVIHIILWVGRGFERMN
jgi:hypothetical protein